MLCRRGIGILSCRNNHQRAVLHDSGLQFTSCAELNDRMQLNPVYLSRTDTAGHAVSMGHGCSDEEAPAPLPTGSAHPPNQWDRLQVEYPTHRR